MSKRLKHTDRIIVNIPDYDGAGIYKIENIRTGKTYVGSSINIKRRITSHDQAMRTGHCNYRFLDDVMRGDKFKVTILEYMTLPTRYELYERELFYVEKEDSYRNGYNSSEVHFNTKPAFDPDGTQRLSSGRDILISTTRKRTRPTK